MPRHIHGLMQDPDHEYPVPTHLVENQVPTRDQFACALQKIRAVRPHLRIGDQPLQGTIDVVEIAVCLRRAPLSVCLGPDVDEIGSCGLGEMDVTHQERRSGSAPRA